MNSIHKEERFILLDVVKIFAFYAIVCYHFFDEFWFESDEIFLRVVQQSTGIQIARFFCINFQSAGFILSFICLALVGFRRYSERRLFKIAGVLVLLFTVYNGFLYLNDMEILFWDFIPLLILTFCFTATGVKAKWPMNKIQICLGLLVLFPFWKLGSADNSFLLQVFFGACDGDVTSWFIFPWFGFTNLAIGLGRLAAEHREKLRKAQKWEQALCLLAVGPFSYAFLEYNQNQFTSLWECAAFRHPVWVFVSLLVGTIAICRISLLDRTNQVLRLLGLHGLGRLRLCRQTGLAYFIHYIPVAILAATLDRHLLFYPMANVYIVLGIFFFPELVLRLVSKRDTRT